MMVKLTMTVWFRCLLLLTYFTAKVWAVAAPADDLLEYDVRATISNSKISTKIIQPCSRSLFSPERFEIKGEMKLLDDFGCSSISTVHTLTIGVAKRGKCSFEQKARAAVDSGLIGIIIINLDKTAFPVGGADPTYRCPIPVAMVGNLSLDDSLLTHSQGSPLTTIHLVDQATYDEERKSPMGFLKSNQLVVNTLIPYLSCTIAILGSSLMLYSLVSIVYFQPVFLESRQSLTTNSSGLFSNISKIIFYFFFILMLSCWFLLPRLATLRLITTGTNSTSTAKINQNNANTTSLLGIFNHRENDEVIFEMLVRSVLTRGWDQYTLQSTGLIETLSLPEENYDHALFIHPPAFVYLSAWLYSTWRVPLPLIPVLFQWMTMLCLPLIVTLLYSNSSDSDWSRVGSVSSKAMIIFMCCPIATFCCQHFWIDSMLVCTCTLSVTLHLLLSYFFARSPASDNILVVMTMVYSISGIVFGGLALNTKVTALALLPFFLLHITLHRFQQPHKKQSNKWMMITLECLAFVTGMIAAHYPWIKWYHDETGRWLPSAWPSADMLERFPFVKMAVMRPWYHYIVTLLQIAPMHLLGLVFGFIAVPHCFYQVLVASTIKAEDDRRRHNYISVLLMFVAAMGFLGGLTVLGALGAGFQMRFLLPMVPFCSILAAIVLGRISQSDDLVVQMTEMILWMAIVYSAVMSFYYGILYSTAFADIEHSLAMIIGGLLQSPYSTAEQTKEVMQHVTGALKHFGLYQPPRN